MGLRPAGIRYHRTCKFECIGRQFTRKSGPEKIKQLEEIVKQLSESHGEPFVLNNTLNWLHFRSRGASQAGCLFWAPVAAKHISDDSAHWRFMLAPGHRPGNALVGKSGGWIEMSLWPKIGNKEEHTVKGMNQYTV